MKNFERAISHVPHQRQLKTPSSSVGSIHSLLHCGWTGWSRFHLSTKKQEEQTQLDELHAVSSNSWHTTGLKVLDQEQLWQENIYGTSSRTALNLPIKIIDGCTSLAMPNRARTIFSLSPTWAERQEWQGQPMEKNTKQAWDKASCVHRQPDQTCSNSSSLLRNRAIPEYEPRPLTLTHLEVNADALMLKNLQSASLATAFAWQNDDSQVQITSNFTKTFHRHWD